MKAKIIHALVQSILENAHKHEWSLQGFGMLRTSLPNGCRLNIWNRHYRVENVSLIHTHPWHFDSFIERGTLRNTRFVDVTRLPVAGPKTHHSALIKPGPEGGLMEGCGLVSLLRKASETYKAGEVYHQDAREIHLSDPSDGCVTVNLRERTGPDEALVFWPLGEEWVSAKPRSAMPSEIDYFVNAALLCEGNQ